MEQILITSHSVPDPAHGRMTLQYYLLSELLDSDGMQFELYGLQILCSSGKAMERFAARRISPCITPVLALILELADGAVTPVTAPEILQELL